MKERKIDLLCVMLIFLQLIWRYIQDYEVHQTNYSSVAWELQGKEINHIGFFLKRGSYGLQS